MNSCTCDNGQPINIGFDKDVLRYIFKTYDRHVVPNKKIKNRFTVYS